MEYERFTEKQKGKNVIPLRNAVCGVDLPKWSIYKHSDIQSFLSGDAVDRLAELEDDLESGKIIRLPCKVGDTVYEVFKDHIPPFIKETKIKKIVVTGKGLRLRLSRNSFYETAISSLGKTVFLTREEAEAKLKELQNG